ncbi:MAG: alpha/beta hydrolase [Promethearchaeota archaeon]
MISPSLALRFLKYLIKDRFYKPPKLCDRYVLDTFIAKSLEGNPLGSPAERQMRIYLPPGYHEDGEQHYPVIYYMHGYNGSKDNWTILSVKEKIRSIPVEVLPKRLVEQIDLDRLVRYEKIDALIEKGELPPFILVQPDASLNIPVLNKMLGAGGVEKGRFYVDSPYSGNCESEIVNDVVEHVDRNYRTIPDRHHRAIIGGSMGGYGALYLGIRHPDKFIAAVGLSPADFDFDLSFLKHQLVIPLLSELFGEKMAKKIGFKSYIDILDTIDLVFTGRALGLAELYKKSQDKDVLEKIEKDIQEKIENLTDVSWKDYELNNLIRKCSKQLDQLNIMVNCEERDEFGLAEEVRKIHNTLKQLKIKHEFEIYFDEQVSLSPHILGIGFHILAGLEYCCQFFK